MANSFCRQYRMSSHAVALHFSPSLELKDSNLFQHHITLIHKVSLVWRNLSILHRAVTSRPPCLTSVPGLTNTLVAVWTNPHSYAPKSEE